MNTSFRHLSLLASMLLLLSWCGAAQAQSTLRWGADPSGGAPYVFIDPEHPDRYVGYELEMVEALARRMNRRAQLVPADWETIVPSLQRGAFDVIVNGLEPTADRASQILFSDPYYIFQLQLTVRASETEIRSLADCRNRVVGTLGNTAASRLLEAENIPFRGYADPVGAYRDLELGRTDAVLMDVPMEMYYARGNKNLKSAGASFHNGFYVIGLRRGDEALKREVDAAIASIISDGTLEGILRKWNLWNDRQAELQAKLQSEQTGLPVGAGQAANAYDAAAKSFDWIGAIVRLSRAAIVTVLIAFGAMLIALTLGMPLALGQMSGPVWLGKLCTIYIEFFRGTPVLVQLLFLYFGLPKLGLAMPGYLTATVGLGLNYAAYESQVYRAALLAVPAGQWEAAYSLGMSPALAFRRIILPQGFRIALPPMTNDFVTLFKDTSVAFAISVWELATAYRELANASGEFLLLGAIVAAFYLMMSLPLARFANRLERKLGDRRAIANPAEVKS